MSYAIFHNSSNFQPIQILVFLGGGGGGVKEDNGNFLYMSHAIFHNSNKSQPIKKLSGKGVGGHIPYNRERKRM